MRSSLTVPETPGEVKEWEALRAQAEDQDMCPRCAVETAYYMQHGLSLMADLAPCKSCDKKLNPSLVFNRRTEKYEVRKMPVRAASRRRCEVCRQAINTTRSDARFCSPRCRKASNRRNGGVGVTLST